MTEGKAPAAEFREIEVRVDARHLEAWKSLGIAYLARPDQGARHAIVSDEPPRRGGEDRGPTPLEYVLVALCA